MEAKLEGTVNYFELVDSTLDAAKQTEEAARASRESLFKPTYILKPETNLQK